MRLHRFFVSEPIGDRAELAVASRPLADQLRKVLRYREGDEVVLFDGSGSDHEAVIARFDGADRVAFDMKGRHPSRSMPSRAVMLCAAVIKKDNFELAAEKAVELGVTDIIPVLAERSEKRSLNMERLGKIAIEASEQSGRGDVPLVSPIATIEEALAAAERKGARPVAFHTEGERFSRASLPEGAAIALFIGPEGGWSPEEAALFHRKGVLIACLGPQILRAETAVIAALSLVAFAG
ncbi:MAG: 16S rRNA (uracil(1498)-N(3))-methyltransferase [Patescibacteria group bacterium]|nr:16S rRNA (uracil(1498)-N(3))-methyltransferase [Patescibacteria group bacterium]